MTVPHGEGCPTCTRSAPRPHNRDRSLLFEITKQNARQTAHERWKGSPHNQISDKPARACSRLLKLTSAVEISLPARKPRIRPRRRFPFRPTHRHCGSQSVNAQYTALATPHTKTGPGSVAPPYGVSARPIRSARNCVTPPRLATVCLGPHV